VAVHHLNKVVLDFSFSKKEESTALHATKQLFYDKALPHISTSFDKIHHNFYIDKLEVDLGKTTLENFKEDFSKALNKSLQDHAFKTKIYEEDQQKHSDGFTLDSLLHFLEKGYWPWNIQRKNEDEITQLIQTLFEKDNMVSLLLHKLQPAEFFLTERLTDLVFGNKVLAALFIIGLQKYHPALHSSGLEITTDWVKNIQDNNSFHYYFTRQLITASPLLTLQDVHFFLKEMAGISSFAPDIVSKKIKAVSNISIAEITVTSISSFYTALQELWNKPNNRNKTVKKIIEAPGANFTKHPAPGSISNRTYFTAETETEKINILNAGLILFHPFLYPAFLDMKWVDAKKEFVSLKAQQKAILFLQFLMTGKSRQPEHQLVLNKILCNWPVHLPMTTKFNFSQKEKEAATDLAESLKEHWPVLKNTSLQGLVVSFVERPGVVQKTSNGFLLQVERKTIDILLDSLPFGINTIKLPWNEYIIHTEW